MVSCPVIIEQREASKKKKKKRAPSGNYVTNANTAAMFEEGWLVSVSEARALCVRKTRVFVDFLVLLCFDSLSNVTAMSTKKKE